MASTKANAVTGITSTCIFYLMKRACIGFSKKPSKRSTYFLNNAIMGTFIFVQVCTNGCKCKRFVTMNIFDVLKLSQIHEV
jgi:hypothetical protein